MLRGFAARFSSAHFVLALSVLFNLGFVPTAQAQFEAAIPRADFAGNHNYQVTGGTLRSSETDGCALVVGGADTASISGIPIDGDATITAAYLYWGGSGSTADNSVTLNGAAVAPLGIFTAPFTEEAFPNQWYDIDYFGAVGDVTSIVQSAGGNGSYTFAGLSVDTSTDGGSGTQADPWTGPCRPAAVVAGWALVVFYSDPDESYRYTRLYDGLQYFRGDSVTTNQSGFRVPVNDQDGKITVVTWEGDVGSSGPLNGNTEELELDSTHPSFPGPVSLDSSCNTTDNIYNSTISDDGSGLCDTSSYGVDIDTSDISGYLQAGQADVSLRYSSGNDLVFLTAQVISTTNTPVIDLSIDKSHAGDFAAGGSGSFEIAIRNNGPEIAVGDNTVVPAEYTQVTDTLPAGLTYDSFSGTGWSCSAAGQDVTCTHTDDIAVGADLPTLTLNVDVAPTAPASLDNTAVVSHPMFDSNAANNTDTDTVALLSSDLSTSTKDVEDRNGGDANPGDTLRYTIELINSGDGDANDVGVTDDIPANVTGFTVISTPAGSSDDSTAGGGANGTGYLDIGGIAVPADDSVTVVFDVTVGAVAPGTLIDNTANVSDPAGTDPALDASTVIVSQSQIAASGNKILYVYDNQELTRTPQPANSTSPVVVPGGGGSQDWSMTPVIPAGKSLTLSAGTVATQLVITSTGAMQGNPRPITVELRSNSGPINTNTATLNIDNGNDGLVTFNLTVPQTTLPAGDRLILRVTNDEFQGPNPRPDRTIDVSQMTALGRSTVTFQTTTVINVDSVESYSAPYPATTAQGMYDEGETVYIRATISDPFGSYDVAGATLDITDSDDVVQVNDAAMTQVADSGGASKTYEYAYTIPAGAALDFWTASVTGLEGTEGDVTHTGNGAFGVGVPELAVVKFHSGDFVAGADASYSLVVSNNGPTVAGTTTVTDTLDPSLSFVSGTGSGWSCSAVGQDVTCTNPDTIPTGTSLPTITLTVAVAGSAPDVVNNAASVSNPNVSGGDPQMGNTDAATVLRPDLSTSTKTVADLNGGDAAPGDILRYTINLIETDGTEATDIGVTDDIPAGVTGFTVVSTPPGSTNSSTGGGGANGTGYLDITNISVAANGSATIVFDVTISGAAVAGDNIDNTAVIDNPNGEDATPAARTITVLQSQVAASGDKILYVYDNLELTRTVQTVDTLSPVVINGGGATQDWLMTPVIPAGQSLTLSAGTATATLVMSAANNALNADRPVTVELRTGSGTIATSDTINVAGAPDELYTFELTVPQTTLAAGDRLVMRVRNNVPQGPRRIAMYQQTLDWGNSTLSFGAETVINVDSVDIYSQAYPEATTETYYVHGDTLYVRSVISDPFGSDDVTGANVTITDTDGTPLVMEAAMTEVVAAATTASKTFEYEYTIPDDAELGLWNANVTGLEGTEDEITHSGNVSFEVRGNIVLTKVWDDATADDAVDLTITGGTDATEGTSTAPDTTTPATAVGAASATITLTEAFTTGNPGNYSPGLACVKDSDSTTVAVTGTGLSRSIEMPADSSVTCTWTNATTVPLTMVKLSQVYSDPFNGTTNPKAIPGAYIDYTIILANPAANPIDQDTVVINDAVPDNVDMFVGDMGGSGSGPIAFIDGSPSSGLTYTFTALGNASDDIEFFNNLDPHTPTPDGEGFDPAVTSIRVNPKGEFNADNATFTIKFRVRIE